MPRRSPLYAVSNVVPSRPREVSSHGWAPNGGCRVPPASRIIGVPCRHTTEGGTKERKRRPRTQRVNRPLTRCMFISLWNTCSCQNPCIHRGQTRRTPHPKREASSDRPGVPSRKHRRGTTRCLIISVVMGCGYRDWPCHSPVLSPGHRRGPDDHVRTGSWGGQRAPAATCSGICLPRRLGHSTGRAPQLTAHACSDSLLVVFPVEVRASPAPPSHWLGGFFLGGESYRRTPCGSLS